MKQLNGRQISVGQRARPASLALATMLGRSGTPLLEFLQVWLVLSPGRACLILTAIGVDMIAFSRIDLFLSSGSDKLLRTSTVNPAGQLLNNGTT